MDRAGVNSCVGRGVVLLAVDAIGIINHNHYKIKMHQKLTLKQVSYEHFSLSP